MHPAPSGRAPDTWHLKDADGLIDPSIAVSVRGAAGQLLEAVQETPAAVEAGKSHLRWAGPGCVRHGCLRTAGGAALS
jgi:hypothetical protein